MHQSLKKMLVITTAALWVMVLSCDVSALASNDVTTLPPNDNQDPDLHFISMKLAKTDGNIAQDGLVSKAY